MLKYPIFSQSSGVSYRGGCVMNTLNIKKWSNDSQTLTRWMLCCSKSRAYCMTQIIMLSFERRVILREYEKKQKFPANAFDLVRSRMSIGHPAL